MTRAGASDRSPPRPRRGRSTRGQTTLDFLVGVSIFLLTTGFVFGFVPQVTAPYQDQSRPIVAERVASDLADDRLATPGAPGVLDEACTDAFFAQTAVGDCAFDPDDEALHEQLAVSRGYSVNVTLAERDGERAVGPPVPERSRSVATARRTVSVGGEDALLEVNVW